jgi:BirA family transcriptional regulator, biotin operon repressor / biotin---[acetyl-CoA-carboxylase] ligase
LPDTDPTAAPEAFPIIWLDEVDSTNAEARRRAEAGERGPVWISARRQSAGRGRQGRAWETGQGNLAATLLTSIDRSAAEAAQLSFVTGLAVVDTVGAIVDPALVTLKWPNDVLLAGAKLAGILIESGRGDGVGLWLAIGVGVNLASAPDVAAYPATALAAHLGPGAVPPRPERILEALSAAMSSRMRAWLASGFGPVRGDWLSHGFGLGETCAARLGDGRTLQGVAEGLDEDGALLLRLASGEVRRITAGDVFFGGG